MRCERTSSDDRPQQREQVMALKGQAVAAVASQERACAAISRSERSLQRGQNDKAEGTYVRRPARAQTPWNRLSGLECQRVHDRQLAGVRNEKQQAGAVGPHIQVLDGSDRS
jgi:hypothetical protein